jgi:hypothetical protein
MQTIDGESLRLAVGLVHAVPGAELHLRTAEEQVVVVGGGPAADVDPCSMRRAIMMAACPAAPDPSQWITGLEIKGALQALGGGLFRPRGEPGSQRWFATLLPSERVLDLLGALDLGDVPDDALLASVRPDQALGLASVCIELAAPCMDARLDEIASGAYASCLVEELIVGRR